jgi:hypothetical protein
VSNFPAACRREGERKTGDLFLVRIEDSSQLAAESFKESFSPISVLMPRKKVVTPAKAGVQ